MPSTCTLLARRDWPLTLLDSESCELKNSECGLNGREAPGTVAIMPWKLRPKPSGIAAICAPSMMRPVSVRSVCSAGVSEVTVTTSLISPVCNVEIDADGRVHVDADVLADDLLEAGEFGFDAIDAVLDVREVVDAALVGDGRGGNVGALFGDGDRGAGHRPAAGVGDRSEQRPSSGLGIDGRLAWPERHQPIYEKRGKPTRAANVVPAPSTPLLASLGAWEPAAPALV